jgi:predicted O-methyltransferase YrrM
MDRDTEMMKEFNQTLVRQINFETLQLPLRDGMTIVRKKS